MPEFSPKENIIFFSLEMKRKDFFQSFGGIYPSPNMSRLAQSAMTFENMFAAAPNTKLSLNSTLYGCYPYKLNAYFHHDKESAERSIFRAMSEKGYRTFIVISEHLSKKYISGILDEGIAEVSIIPTDEFSTQAAAKRVAEIYEEVDGPKFIFSHCSPVTLCDERLKKTWRNNFERYVWEDDLAIGHLLDSIDLEHTRLMVASDHGMGLGEHYKIVQHSYFLFDESLRVPCLISDHRPGKTSDLYSLYQLYDAVVNEKLSPQEHIIADSQYPCQMHRMTAIRDLQWKYIVHYSWESAVTGLQEELYDVEVDPGEHRNLLNDFSRHPLRYSFNWESLQETGLFSYPHEPMEEKLVSFRSEVARIWQEGLLSYLNMTSPEHGKALKDKLSHASDTERLASIGTIARSLHPEMPVYGGRDNVVKNGEIPFNFPGIPKEPHSIHFARIGDTGNPRKFLGLDE